MKRELIAQELKIDILQLTHVDRKKKLIFRKRKIKSEYGN